MSNLIQYISAHSEQFRKTRLPSLYSDFRLQRASNPDGYAANISAWENALRDAVSAQQVQGRGRGGGQDGRPSVLCLDVGEELLTELETSELGRPLALGAVVDEAVARGSMIPVRVFKSYKSSIYKQSTGQYVWRSLTWGLRQLGITTNAVDTGENVKAGSYIFMKNLEEASKKVLDHFDGGIINSSRVNRIMSHQAFKQEVSTILALSNGGMSETDVQLLLVYMSRDMSKLAFNAKAVKFLNTVEEDDAVLTSEDETIASLKTLMHDLEMQISSVTNRVSELKNKAQSAVSQGNKASAMAALRSKRLAESVLNRRTATLTQLEEVFHKIEQAADQVEFVRLMEASTKVLRGLSAEIGDVDKIDNIVDDLRDEMTKVDDVAAQIAEVDQLGPVVDEDELDTELANMQRESQGEQELLESRTVEQRLKDIVPVPARKGDQVGHGNEGPEDRTAQEYNREAHNSETEKLPTEA